MGKKNQTTNHYLTMLLGVTQIFGMFRTPIHDSALLIAFIYFTFLMLIIHQITMLFYFFQNQ